VERLPLDDDPDRLPLELEPLLKELPPPGRAFAEAICSLRIAIWPVANRRETLTRKIRSARRILDPRLMWRS
jgi:hypothetical protein